MEARELQPAKLDDQTLSILREAEVAINQHQGSEGRPDEEIYLVALKRRPGS